MPHQIYKFYRLTPYSLGATGYIGGDALYAVAHAHPEYEITALVRNSEKGAQVVSQYPKIKLVYGDSNSSTLIEDETKKADVVLRKSSQNCSQYPEVL